MRCQQLDYVKQERRIFSTFFKASFPETANGISSLVYGGDFVHIYTLDARDGIQRMVVNTYSKHGNASFDPTRFELVIDAVTAMTRHLKVRMMRVMIRIILIMP